MDRSAASALPEPEAWLRAYAAVQRPADAEILDLLREANRDVQRQIRVLRDAGDTPSNHLRREQLLAVKQNVLNQLSDFYDRTGNVIARRRVQVAARAIDVSARYDAALFGLAGREDEIQAIRESFKETELRTLDAAVARMTRTAQPLSSRVYRTRAFTNDLLSRRINSALARGLSAQELAADISDFVRPDTPGGVRYAALRLARTEINNAFHAMAIQAAMDKPWVDKMQWHLSRSHPRRGGKPEACELLDGRMFKPEDVPRKPHPQCLCIVSPVVDSSQEAEDEFLDALVGGEFNEFLDRFASVHGL